MLASMLKTAVENLAHWQAERAEAKREREEMLRIADRLRRVTEAQPVRQWNCVKCRVSVYTDTPLPCSWCGTPLVLVKR